MGITSGFSILSPHDSWEVEVKDDTEKNIEENDSSDGEDTELRAAREAEERKTAAGK